MSEIDGTGVRRSLLRPAVGLIGLASVLGLVAAAETATPATAPQLDPSGARKVSNVTLRPGPADIVLEEGTVIPAASDGPAGAPAEFVFVGKGSVTVAPPDDVEAGQLELFTGSRSLDAEFSEAVLVVPLQSDAARLLAGEAEARGASGQGTGRAAEIWTGWSSGGLRRLFHVGGKVEAARQGDPAFERYFAAQFKSEALGEFVYLVDPESEEAVTLGQFIVPDLNEREKRHMRRQLESEQAEDHLIGLDLADLGEFDTWMSAAIAVPGGGTRLGLPAVEPERYTVEVRIARGVDSLNGTARIDARATESGRRVVSLSLSLDLALEQVTDERDVVLPFIRSGSSILVQLPRPTRAGEPVVLKTKFSGNPFNKAEWKVVTLRSTLGWHPHAGRRDRARYDVTIHWPRGYDLMASGQRSERGESRDVRWERRVSDTPGSGFTFEIGDFDVTEQQVGHVKLIVAFDREMAAGSKAIRTEIAEAAADSLAYFEEIFGPLPMDELKVVTTPRYFSQGLPGFVTLSQLMMTDFGLFSSLFDLEDRRTVIAHELAHQWWGNQVASQTYHDYWLSEGMANYAALLYQRHRIPGGGKDTRRRGPTTRWREELEALTNDGRTIESLGPITLGPRLDSSKSDAAYDAIVYTKGAMVLDMLAKVFREERFVGMLGQISRRAAGMSMSTDTFFAAIEKLSGEDLDWFVAQYIHGTGIPEIYYSHRIEKAGDGSWVINGNLKAIPRNRLRYRAVAREGGGFDLRCEGVPQGKPEQWNLVLPFQVLFHDPERVPGNDDSSKSKPDTASPRANAQVNGRFTITDLQKPFSVEIEQEPIAFYLDRNGEVLAHFYSETRYPRRSLRFQGETLLAAGRWDEAESALRKALQAPYYVTDRLGDEEQESRLQEKWEKRAQLEESWIHLGLARLQAEQGRVLEGRAEIRSATKAAPERPSINFEAEVIALEARLDLVAGDAEGAYRRLKSAERKNLGGRTETRALMAVAAQMTGHKRDAARAREALENKKDVDLSALGPKP